MAAQSKEQKETVERVMHEFKHGELETSAGTKVKNPKEAIAIGRREAGASKYESDEKNEENLKRTKQRGSEGEGYRRPLDDEQGCPRRGGGERRQVAGWCRPGLENLNVAMIGECHAGSVVGGTRPLRVP